MASEPDFHVSPEKRAVVLWGNSPRCIDWGAFPQLRRVEPSGRWVLRGTGLSTNWTSAPAEGFCEHYSLLSSHPIQPDANPSLPSLPPPCSP